MSAANTGVANDNSAAVRTSFFPMTSPPTSSAFDQDDGVKSSCRIKRALGPVGGAIWTDGRPEFREKHANSQPRSSWLTAINRIYEGGFTRVQMLAPTLSRRIRQT